jgi:multiple sugar transport system substrate-binding protein
MQRLVRIVIASLLLAAPLGARAADLVVWWDKGASPEEDAAVKETIAAFEQKTGKQVELVFSAMDEHSAKVVAALEADRPPDFAFGFDLNNYYTKWALEDRLVDLSEAVGNFSSLFDPHQLGRAVLLNARTHQKHLYGLPMGFATNHLHVWKSLLEYAGFTLENIPKGRTAFWSFWCDQVQPAVRRATVRDDIWGIGLYMSAESDETVDQFFQFMQAYQANYVTPEGKLVIDDPDVRRKLVRAIDDYTAIYRKGCTPPDSATWKFPMTTIRPFSIKGLS